MQLKKILYIVLMTLPILVTLALLPSMPDQVPMHYGFDSQVNRWGSKYEMLIFPVLTLVVGIFLLASGSWSQKKGRISADSEEYHTLLPSNDKKRYSFLDDSILLTGTATLILFNALTYVFLYMSLHADNEDFSVIGSERIIFGLLGLFMIFVGNVMPNLRKNSIFGLRNKWSLKNDTAWKKSQHAAGITCILSGIAIALLCVFTSGQTCIWGTLIILVIMLVIDLYYSRKAAEEC